MAEDGTAIALTPLTGDSDPDGGTLSITSINGTLLTPGTAQVIAVTNGTVNVSAAGVITFTPAPDYSGSVSFPYIDQRRPGRHRDRQPDHHRHPRQ